MRRMTHTTKVWDSLKRLSGPDTVAEGKEDEHQFSQQTPDDTVGQHEHIVDLSSIPYGVVSLTGIGMKEWLEMDPN